MIAIKTEKEIEAMAEGGRILSETLHEVLSHIKPGVSELELDQLAEKLIVKSGGEPGFKKVRGYRHTICVSTNDVVVHGVPGNYKLKEGDVIGIDGGVYYKGFHTDMSETVQVKSHPATAGSKVKSDNEIKRFLETGKRALEEAIRVTKVGNRIGHISKTIQDIVEEEGYSIVRSLVGHGVGRNLHEEPEVPGFLASKIEETPFLKNGMTLAIEVIYNRGKADVMYANDDGWTIKTLDGSTSGVFERTIAITKEEPYVLTK